MAELQGSAGRWRAVMGAKPSTGRPPIIQYWDTGEPPAEVAALMASFAASDPDMPYLAFDERSAANLIAEHLGERHMKAFRACAVPSMQADYFRYCAVHALGGVYVDADFRSCRALQPLLEPEGQLFEQPPRGPMMNNLFAFRAPKHPFLALSIEYATRNIESRASNNVALTTGPSIFTSLVQAGRGLPLSDLRELAHPTWRPEVDASWEALSDSLSAAVDSHGPPSAALEGVRISSRAEMLTWVDRSAADLPYKSEDDYWANWSGSIFRSPDGRPQ